MIHQMGSNVQEVERTNGLTNLNPIYGRQDHHFRPSLYIYSIQFNL